MWCLGEFSMGLASVKQYDLRVTAVCTELLTLAGRAYRVATIGVCNYEQSPLLPERILAPVVPPTLPRRCGPTPANPQSLLEPFSRQKWEARRWPLLET